MQTDPELVRLVKQRDEAAFDALVARHEAAVLRRVADIVRDRAAAEDLAQEVLLRLWTRIDGFSGGSIRAWLLRIATNLALNARRDRRRRQGPLVPGADPDRVQAPRAAGPQARSEAAERCGLLHRALGGLPAGKREVVRRVHEEQKELHRVADELGIPLGTVKSRLHYALRDLARAIRELEGDEEHADGP